MHPDRLACVVCAKRPRVRFLLCAACARSYDKTIGKTHTIAALIEWAAQRARFFEKERKH